MWIVQEDEGADESVWIVQGGREWWIGWQQKKSGKFLIDVYLFVNFT